MKIFFHQENSLELEYDLRFQPYEKDYGHSQIIKKILNRNKEAVGVAINLVRLQVLHRHLTQIMTHQKPNELAKRAVREAAHQSASLEAEHQNVVRAVEVAAEVEIVEIEVVQEKNRAKESNDRNVHDQGHGQDRKKNERHQQKT